MEVLPVILLKACRRYRRLASSAFLPTAGGHHSNSNWDHSNNNSTMMSSSSRSGSSAVNAIGNNGLYSVASPLKGNHRSGGGGGSGRGASSGNLMAANNHRTINDDGCRGEFDPAIEAVKVAKGTAKLLVRALNTLQQQHSQVFLPDVRKVGLVAGVMPFETAPSLPPGEGGGGPEGRSEEMLVEGGGERGKNCAGPARRRARVAAALASSKAFCEAVREVGGGVGKL